MEVDVAVDGGVSTSRSALQISSDDSREREERAARAFRKSKEPAALVSSTLKSILRQNRSDLSAAGITLKTMNSPCGGQKMRHKRSVNFNLEGKSNEVRHWSGKRLRCLALDLDRRDVLPSYHQPLQQQQRQHNLLPHQYRHHQYCHHPYKPRYTNKQKSRHTKHPTFGASSEDVTASGGGRGRGVKPDMTPSSSQLLLELEGKDSSSIWKCLCCDYKDQFEQLMEKSYYISKWLRHNKREPSKSIPLRDTNSTTINTTTRTTTTYTNNRGYAGTMLKLPAVSFTKCVISDSDVMVATSGSGSFPVGVSRSSLSLPAQCEDPVTSSPATSSHCVSLQPLRSDLSVVSNVKGDVVGDDAYGSSDAALPFPPVVFGRDEIGKEPATTPSILNLTVNFNGMYIGRSSYFRKD